MSNQVNTTLLEEAAEHIEYWTGTVMSKILERDVATGDLDQLRVHLNESRTQMFDREYNPNEA